MKDIRVYSVLRQYSAAIYLWLLFLLPKLSVRQVLPKLFRAVMIYWLLQHICLTFRFVFEIFETELPFLHTLCAYSQVVSMFIHKWPIEGDLFRRYHELAIKCMFKFCVQYTLYRVYIHKLYTVMCQTANSLPFRVSLCIRKKM